MVTTFSPPVRAKKKSTDKLPILPIGLGVVALALLAGLIMLNNNLTKERAQGAALKDTLIASASAAGLANVTAESLADETSAPALLESIPVAINNQVAALQTAQGEVAQARSALTQLEGQSTEAQQQVTTLRTQLETVRSEAKAKTDELMAAQKKAEAEVVALNAVVSELQGQLSASEAPGAEEPEVVEEIAEETAVGVDAVDQPEGEEPAPKRSNSTTVIPEGKSSLFKSVRYDAGKSRMIFLTLDDKVITYSDVPGESYDALIAADLFDIHYRFRVMDVFPSDPNDREVVRSIGK